MATKKADDASSNKSKGVVTVTCTLKSIGNGMLQNPMTDDTLKDLLTGTRRQVDKTLSPEKIAEGRVMKNPNSGKPGIKIEYLTGCLAEAGRKVKNGKSQISTATSTTIWGIIDFGDVSFLDFSKAGKWEADMRKGNLKNGPSSVAVAIVRPLFKQWEIKLSFTVDENECDATVVKELFTVAGKQVGIGDFRPAKKGPFGRFEVVDWKIEK